MGLFSQLMAVTTPVVRWVAMTRKVKAKKNFFGSWMPNRTTGLSSHSPSTGVSEARHTRARPEIGVGLHQLAYKPQDRWNYCRSSFPSRLILRQLALPLSAHTAFSKFSDPSFHLAVNWPTSQVRDRGQFHTRRINPVRVSIIYWTKGAWNYYATVQSIIRQNFRIARRRNRQEDLCWCWIEWILNDLMISGEETRPPTIKSQDTCKKLIVQQHP